VDKEEVHYQEIKTMCSSPGTEVGCETAIDVEGSGSQFSCVWVNDAEGSHFCIEKNSAFSCSCYLSSENCSVNVAGNKCVWVTDERERTRCREVKESCSKLSKKPTCLFEGAAISGLGFRVKSERMFY
jgi:hypothetical protein